MSTTFSIATAGLTLVPSVRHKPSFRQNQTAPSNGTNPLKLSTSPRRTVPAAVPSDTQRLFQSSVRKTTRLPIGTMRWE